MTSRRSTDMRSCIVASPISRGIRSRHSASFRPLPHRSAVSYPASLAIDPVQLPSKNDLRNRKIILRRVRQDWIREFWNSRSQASYGWKWAWNNGFKPSIGRSTRLSKPPEHAAVRLATGITTAFYDCGEALLVLGAPGAGKTTLLLELARDLLQRSPEDQDYPIRSCSISLSWSHRRGRLRRWMIQRV